MKRLLIALTLMCGMTVYAQDADWWQQAGEPYQDVTITGISESTPPSQYVSEVLAPQFTELTGIEVEFEITSWDQMYQNAIQDMQADTGIYDFVYIEQDIVYAYLAQDFLVNVSEALAEQQDLAAPGVDFADFTSFIEYFQDDAGDVYGVPMEAFVKPYVYRTDLFEDPEIQAAFEEQHGRELAPATTHEEYREIAEFFTQYGQDNNMQLWGTTLQATTGHAASTYELTETIFPSFGVYDWGVNLDNYKATVEDGGEMNSDAAKEAFSFWLGLLDQAPPESTGSTWDEVAATFAGGRAAQGWVYGENVAWIATDPERSTVVGNVGVALPPTAEGIMEDAESGEGYVGYYDGGAFGIPHSSRNQEAALLWLQYIALPELQPEWAAAGARITLEQTYDDPLVQELDEQTNGYFTFMREQGHLFAGAPPFPFHNSLVETMNPHIHRAIAGDITPEEALDGAAEDVNQLLIDLGYAE